jgi:hypothetical protein
MSAPESFKKKAARNAELAKKADAAEKAAVAQAASLEKEIFAKAKVCYYHSPTLRIHDVKAFLALFGSIVHF